MDQIAIVKRTLVKNFIHYTLTIPAPPLAIRNSTTPIDPSVICEAIVPKLTTGARHAKYRNNTAGIHFRFSDKASVQSDL